MSTERVPVPSHRSPASKALLPFSDIAPLIRATGSYVLHRSLRRRHATFVPEARESVNRLRLSLCRLTYAPRLFDVTWRFNAPSALIASVWLRINSSIRRTAGCRMIGPDAAPVYELPLNSFTRANYCLLISAFADRSTVLTNNEACCIHHEKHDLQNRGVEIGATHAAPSAKHRTVPSGRGRYNHLEARQPA
ncbi:hypothetical protein R69749_06953 [Paraburkholderia domus]|nr:hypothetical protein R69619_06922 [Paraburkholderia nemoris]CAE6879563.1 hypothetical protein R69749_06953 [Paraburkholderia domus]